MSGARQQVSRLLALAPYLRDRPEGVPLRELADTFGVSHRQLVRDLKVLWMCGLPGYGPDDLVDINMEAFEDDPEGIVKVTNTDYLGRPLRLASSEAAALIVALSAMLESSDDTSRPVVERLLAKLREAAGAEAPAVSVVPATPSVSAPDLGGLRRDLDAAVADNRQVRLDHVVPHRDERTTRVVDPVAVQTHDGTAYLDGWCHLAADRRLFRLDRITSLEVLDSAREHSDLTPLDLSTSLFVPGETAELVTLRLAARARWIAGYYPVETMTEAPDGALDVELYVSDARWLVGLVLGAAPGVEVLAPDSYVAAVREAAQDALAHYPGE